MTNFIGNQLKQFTNTYSNFSTWGKVLFFASLVIICIFLLSGFNKMKEGFEQSDKFLFKTGNDVYDDFSEDSEQNINLNSFMDDIGPLIKNCIKSYFKDKTLHNGNIYTPFWKYWF